MEASTQSIEPEYLSQAFSRGVKLRVVQVNKTEREGILREFGKYEINLDDNGRIVTIPKQDISFLSAAEPLLTPALPPEPAAASEAAHAKPNIQQEFLDKAIREKQHLTVFLLNGQRVKASIEAYDNFTILLRESGRQHLYYKHAVTTINR